MLALTRSHLILKSFTHSPHDEVYLINANTMEVVHASALGKAAFSTNTPAVAPEQFEAIFGISREALIAYVNQQRDQKSTFELSVNQLLPATSVNKNALRVMLIQSDDTEYILVTKNDISLEEKVVMALSESESRFQAIVSNIPGLVFQMQMSKTQEISFHYLSDGCEALLGMTARELEEDAQLLFSIMNAKDRADLREKLASCAESLVRLDWEGRVWIDGWQDTKWINLRATTTRLEDGVVHWDGIMLNITQSKHEKQEIEQSRRDLEQLTAHMNQIKEQERISIAREIHDDLGGNLTAIKIGLASIANQITTGQPVLLEQTSGLEAIVNRTFEAVHRISGNLRPSILDLGIVDAIEWQTTQFKKQVGIECLFRTNQSEVMLSSDQSIALYRVCQESLSNAAKYSKASQVIVDLNVHDDELTMSIIDNGVGIQDEDKFKANAYGLRGMQERISALNGQLVIAKPDNADRGTKVEVKITI
ncbi:MAG: histidine kinase [Methylophilus sp.]|nr:histidine kinase [Methylophilus sp.]